MYRYENWTVKKAEHGRIDLFELWYWRRVLRVPWTARRLYQSFYIRKSTLITGSTDAEAETSILWSPDTKSQHIGNNLVAGKD